MDNKRLQKMVEAAVRVDFDCSVEAFKANPGGDHWKNLVNAMWAMQALRTPETMEQALPFLENQGAGHWIGTLRDVHEGKARKV